MVVMMKAHATTSAEHSIRKRPFRPRKRVLSARTNIEAHQRVTSPRARLNSNFSDTPRLPSKGGAPLGNRNALRHGRYTREQRAFMAEVRAFLRECRATVAAAKAIPCRRVWIVERVHSVNGAVVRHTVVTKVRQPGSAKAAPESTLSSRAAQPHRWAGRRDRRCRHARRAPRPSFPHRLRLPAAHARAAHRRTCRDSFEPANRACARS